MLTLDHVVFPVRDAEATLKFYTDVLGRPDPYEAVRRWTRAAA